jgi:putative ABC transport system ATP-binding protein
MSMDNVLLVNNLKKEYSFKDTDIKVFEKINFRVNKGQFVVIIGPSGSVKSTLLHIIGMLKKPTQGIIELFGQYNVEQIDNKTQKYLRLTRIGFIYQGFNLIPFLTAKENVELPAKLLAERNSKEIDLRASELIKSVGLEHRINHIPSQLSFGEQQRVGIARSFMNYPELILADEPTGNLDSTTSKEIVHLMKELSLNTGTSFVVVTHDQSITAVADRVLVLHNHMLEEVPPILNN